MIGVSEVMGQSAVYNTARRVQKVVDYLILLIEAPGEALTSAGAESGAEL